MYASKVRRRGNPGQLFVGLIVLGLGVLLGFAGRPFVDAWLAARPPGEAVAGALTPATPRSSEPPASLMDAVVARTRHFKGDADAPVTIVEFSDFQ